MTMHVVVDQLIDAPVSTVWADVAQMATHADWMTDAESITFAGDRRSGIGTVMIVPTRVGPFTTEDWIIVTHWEEERAMGVIHVGIVSGVGMFRLEPEGERTRFVWEEDLALPWALGGPLGEIVAKPIVRAIWKANLSRLAARFT